MSHHPGILNKHPQMLCGLRRSESLLLGPGHVCDVRDNLFFSDERTFLLPLTFLPFLFANLCC